MKHDSKIATQQHTIRAYKKRTHTSSLLHFKCCIASYCLYLSSDLLEANTRPKSQRPTLVSVRATTKSTIVYKIVIGMICCKNEHEPSKFPPPLAHFFNLKFIEREGESHSTVTSGQMGTAAPAGPNGSPRCPPFRLWSTCRVQQQARDCLQCTRCNPMYQRSVPCSW